MEFIKNSELLKEYIKHYKINNYFQQDYSSNMQLVEFKKKDHLCIQGDSINYLLFFLKGKAKIYRSLSNGKENIINMIENFHILGEIELLLNQPSLATITALDNCLCIAIPFKDCRNKLLNDLYFLQKISHHLARTTSAIDVNLSINLLLPLESKFASYILSSQKNGHFQCDLKTLPERLGTTYRHFSRILSQFLKLAIIKSHGNDYQIVDWAFLKNKATDFYEF